MSNTWDSDGVRITLRPSRRQGALSSASESTLASGPGAAARHVGSTPGMSRSQSSATLQTVPTGQPTSTTQTTSPPQPVSTPQPASPPQHTSTTQTTSSELPANAALTKPLEGSLTPNYATQFRFLDLPIELQVEILEYIALDHEPQTDETRVLPGVQGISTRRKSDPSMLLLSHEVKDMMDAYILPGPYSTLYHVHANMTSLCPVAEALQKNHRVDDIRRMRLFFDLSGAGARGFFTPQTYNTPPTLVQNWRAKVLELEGVIISFPALVSLEIVFTQDADHRGDEETVQELM